MERINKLGKCLKVQIVLFRNSHCTLVPKYHFFNNSLTIESALSVESLIVRLYVCLTVRNQKQFL